MSTSIDYDKFRALRVTHVATRFEELIKDEANDALTPEQLFLTAVDDAIEHRRHSRVEKLTGRRGSPSRTPSTTATAAASPPCGCAATPPTTGGPTPRTCSSSRRPGGGKTYLACAIGISACHNGHAVACARMDDLARRLVIARGDGIAHRRLLNELSDVDLLVIDDFLTVGIDSDAASDLFAVLANREHRLPTLVASQTGPGYWVQALPDRVAADPSSTGSRTTPAPSTSAPSTCANSAATKPGPTRTTGNRRRAGGAGPTATNTSQYHLLGPQYHLDGPPVASAANRHLAADVGDP